MIDDEYMYKKLLFLLPILLILTACSQPEFVMKNLGVSDIQQEIIDKPYLKLKAPKEKIIESREITVYEKQSLLGATATSSDSLIPITLISYDYVSEEKAEGEFIFDNSQYSNVRVFNENTRDYIIGDIAYKDGEDIYKIIAGATTTLEAFAEQTKITKLDKIKSFFGNKAIAATDYTSTIANSTGVYSVSTVWATAWGATTGELVVQAANGKGTFCGTQYSAPNYYIMKYNWEFPTGAISDTDVISAVEVHVHTRATDSGSADDPDCILLDNTNNANLNKPLQTEDINDFGTTSIGSASYADMIAADGDYAITITDFDFINKTGSSYLGTRNSMDISNTQITGFNRVYTDLGTSGGDPFLRITSGVPSTPSQESDIIDFW